MRPRPATSGTEAKRTARSSSSPVPPRPVFTAPILVAHIDDPRGEGFRPGTESEDTCLRELGLAPGNHRVWSIEEQYLTYEPTDSCLPEGLREILRAEEPGDPFDEVDVPTPGDYENLETLRGQLDAAQRDITQLRNRLEERRTAHEDDINTIAEHLHREAVNRDWCKEYDEVVERMNHNLTVKLPPRENEYEVELEVTYKVTKTVSARDEDSACEKAKEDFDEEDLAHTSPLVEVFDVR